MAWTRPEMGGLASYSSAHMRSSSGFTVTAETSRTLTMVTSGLLDIKILTVFWAYDAVRRECSAYMVGGGTVIWLHVCIVYSVTVDCSSLQR